jgi:hypothetical protein
MSNRKRIEYGSKGLERNGSNGLEPNGSKGLEPNGSKGFEQNGSNGLEQKPMYDLCKIAYFPYKSKEPTKLTHTSCFFGLKGLFWFLQSKLGLKGLIWSL